MEITKSFVPSRHEVKGSSSSEDAGVGVLGFDLRCSASTTANGKAVARATSTISFRASGSKERTTQIVIGDMDPYFYRDEGAKKRKIEACWLKKHEIDHTINNWFYFKHIPLLQWAIYFLTIINSIKNSYDEVEPTTPCEFTNLYPEEV